MPLYTQYERIRYADPRVQAELQRLIENMAATERARAPIQERHQQAEESYRAGEVSDTQYRAVDDEFIGANNKIAAARRKIEEFLNANKDYRVE